MPRINLFQRDNQSFQAWSFAPNYGGSSLDIAKAWESTKLGFHAEVLDPGKFSCPYHRHEREEELFIVLEGKALCREEDQVFEISKGELVFFKTGIAHQFYNHTAEPFIFFALSNKDSGDVCEYPDSKKILNYATKTLTQKGVPTDNYWKDEENPRAHWPLGSIC